MGYINATLDEFDGQLRYSEILNMTYKELGYLKKHRQTMNIRKNKNPSTIDLEREMKKMN